MNATHNDLFREFLTIVKRHRVPAGLVFAITLALVTIVALTAPPSFTATSALFVKFGREFVYRPEVGDLAHAKTYDLEEMVNSEVEILSSRDLASSVVNELTVEALYPELLEEAESAEIATRKAIEKFRDELGVMGVLESSVIRVSFSHHDPELAATSVNRLVDFFRDKHLEVFSDSQSGFLNVRLAKWQETLSTLRNQLQELQATHGLVDAAHQKSLLLSERSTLQLDRRRAEMEQTELAERTSGGPDYGNSAFQSEAIPALLKRREDTATQLANISAELIEVERQSAALRSEDPSEAIRSVLGSTLGIQDFRSVDDAHTKLLELQLQRNQLLQSYQPTNRRVSAVDEDIRRVQSFLDSRSEEIDRYVSSVARSTIASQLALLSAREDQLTAGLERLNNAISGEQERQLRELRAIAGSRQALLDQQIAQINNRLRTLHEVDQTHAQLLLQVANAEEQCSVYQRRLEEARITDDLDRQKQVNIRVIEQAYPPLSATGISAKMKIAMGLVAAVIASVVVAGGLELLRREQNREDSHGRDGRGAAEPENQPTTPA